MTIGVVLFAVFTAFAWVNILTETGQLFAFVPKLVQKWTNITTIHKLTFECAICISGQLALWASVFMFDSVIVTLTNISASIVCVYILQLILSDYEQ